MGKTNIKPHSKSQGMNFTEQICKQARPKQVHQPTFSHHPSHSLQGEGGACGHKVSAAGGTPSCPPASLPSVFFKPCINFKVFFFFLLYHLVYGILIPPPNSQSLHCKCRVLTMELPGKTPFSTFFQNKQESKLISGKTLRQQVGPRRSGKGERTNPAKNPQSTSCQHLATLQDGRSRRLEGGDPSPIRSSV